MTRRIQDAELRVFHPGNTSSSGTASNADFVVPFSDIRELSVSQESGVSRDQASVRIDDSGSTYARDFRDRGDRVAIYVDFGGGLTWVFTGLVQEPVPQLVEPGQPEVVIEQMDDFVAGVMASRVATNAFEQREVITTSAGGGANAIVNVLFNQSAPELSINDQIGRVRKLDARFDDRDLLEAVESLARRVGAQYTSDRKTLVWVDKAGFSSKFQLTSDDYRLPLRSPRDGTQIANKVIVRNGTGYQTGQGQTAQSSTVRVDNSNRETFTFSPASDSVERIDIYTSTTGSGDNVVVRLQRTDGSGNPVAPNDRTQDLGRDSVAASDLTNGGFTRFFPSAEGYTLEVAVLVESDGSTGQDIGVDSNGNVTYQAYVAFSTDVFVESSASQSQHRRADLTVDGSQTNSEASAKELGNTELERQKDPRVMLEFDADSPRAHQLVPTDGFDFSLSSLDISGQWLVTRRDIEYVANRVDSTGITAQRRDTL